MQTVKIEGELTFEELQLLYILTHHSFLNAEIRGLSAKLLTMVKQSDDRQRPD